MTTRLRKAQFWLVLVLIVCIGCRTTLRPGVPPLSEATTLTLEATPIDKGTFTLTGTTNLPDQTQLTAIALRYWVPKDATVLSPESSTALGQSGKALATENEPLYSVLAYQPVTVANGRWSAQLDLWQVAADGRYQEPWQAQAAALNLVAQPKDTVQFAITLAPPSVGTALGNMLPQAGQRLVGKVLRVTAEGEPFLWADQSLKVGLPKGKTSPPTDLLARTNGGWGERYRLVPEPPLPYTLTPENQRQTNAPLTLDERLQ